MAGFHITSHALCESSCEARHWSSFYCHNTPTTMGYNISNSNYWIALRMSVCVVFARDYVDLFLKL